MHAPCGPLARHVRSSSIGLVAAATALLTAVAGASPRDAPADIAGVTKVDAAGVVQLAQTVPQLVIIDSRIAMDRKQGYIEGSVSLPDVDTDCARLARVIPSRSEPAVFYCNGPQCGRSVTAIRIAQACGYTHLYWYRGGVQDWTARDYPYLRR